MFYLVSRMQLQFAILLLVSFAFSLFACGSDNPQSPAAPNQITKSDIVRNEGNEVAAAGKIVDSRIIDNGGSGPYSAIAATEASLTDFVVYRPRDMATAAQSESKLPVLVFANGGCNDTSIPHERLLAEVASHGYVVIALGALQRTLLDRELNKAPNAMMIEAIDWLGEKNSEPGSEYFQKLDLDRIAIGGQSCGGAQVLAVGADPRIKTYMMFNAGIGDMTMAEAQRESLNNLHGPVLFIVGGNSDVATANAELDYARIKHVPVAFSNLLMGGHGGTFDQEFGGSFATVSLKWLDWQLKGENEHADIFLQNELSELPGWTMKSKNF